MEKLKNFFDSVICLSLIITSVYIIYVVMDWQGETYTVEGNVLLRKVLLVHAASIVSVTIRATQRTK